MRLESTPKRLRPVEGAYNRWLIVPVAGVTREEVLTHTYWHHIVGQLREGDVVELRPEIPTWYLELWLTKKEDKKLHWMVLKEVADAPEDPDIKMEIGGLKLEWYGVPRRARVIDIKSPEKPSIAEGFLTLREADEARAVYLKKPK